MEYPDHAVSILPIEAALELAEAHWPGAHQHEYELEFGLEHGDVVDIAATNALIEAKFQLRELDSALALLAKHRDGTHPEAGSRVAQCLAACRNHGVTDSDLAESLRIADQLSQIRSVLDECLPTVVRYYNNMGQHTITTSGCDIPDVAGLPSWRMASGEVEDESQPFAFLAVVNEYFQVVLQLLLKVREAERHT